MAPSPRPPLPGTGLHRALELRTREFIVRRLCSQPLVPARVEEGVRRRWSGMEAAPGCARAAG